MKLIEAEKAKDVIHEYFKSLMVNGASGTDVDRLAVGIGSCLKHDANLLKAIDELPSAEQDTATHDSIPAETGKNDGDGTSGDCISRQQSVDTLRKMQTYKLFAGDDMLLIDQAEAQTELMMLPSTQPEIIRCKDCIYQVESWSGIKCCEAHGDHIGKDYDYCSNARRKKNGH
jgi:hypothetical protein